MIYPRKLKAKVLGELYHERTIVITGMRRVGKTSLLRDIFHGVSSPNKIFIDLENEDQQAIFETKSYESILTALGKTAPIVFTPRPGGDATPSPDRAWIFIDEIQRVRNIPSIIKYLSDHYEIKFIVTGSSSYYLKNLFTESLAGRKVIVHLAPLDFGEYLLFHKESPMGPVHSLAHLAHLDTAYARTHYLPYFNDYLVSGGFPQVVLEGSSKNRRAILADILSSYFTLDVRTLSDFRGIAELRKLVALLPPRIGQKLDTRRLSRETGTAWITTKQYLEFLADTFVMHTVTPFTKSPDREISSVPKLYFCDHALGASLAIISEGQTLENLCYTHFSDRSDVQYYQRKSGLEVDFILDGKIGVEVKSFATPSDVRRLARIGRSLGLSETYVITGRFGEEIIPGILPAYTLGFLA